MLCRHTSIFRAGHLRSSADLVGLPHAVSRRVWTLEIRSSVRRAAYGALDVACILGPFSAPLERFPVHWDGFFCFPSPPFLHIERNQAGASGSSGIDGGSFRFRPHSLKGISWRSANERKLERTGKKGYFGGENRPQGCRSFPLL